MTKEIKLPFDLELPQAQILKAGMLTCLYDTGNLRYICLNRTELVRKIYGAVRDEQWTTMPYEIQDEIVAADATGFVITYTAIYGDKIKLYKADYIIEGKPDNTISFSMKGTALAGFKRNRIGLCLHHPLKECYGRAVKVTRPDGPMYHSVFPVLVSPSLLFLEIHQLEWITEDRIRVKQIFEGDVFDTEDQRNWSDSSYKTYSTRSNLPIPVDVVAGETIEQRITLEVSGNGNTGTTESSTDKSEIKIPFPQIGYGKSAGSVPINSEVIEWLIKIPFDHYRVTITMNQTNWHSQLQEALKEASLINTRLELVVFFSHDYKNEIVQLTDRLKEKQLLVRSILVLQLTHNVSPGEVLEYVYPFIKARLPAVKTGYGTNAIFVDVNQHRPAGVVYDFISFGIHPQAHAFDNRSILENLSGQPDMMKTAMKIATGQPVFISPVTLKDTHSDPDKRQHAFFTALWTLLTLQNFSEAYSITFFELFGAAGILSAEKQESELTVTIKPSPVYGVLATIFDFNPVWVIKRFLGDALLMDGLLLEDENGNRLFFEAPEEYKHSHGWRSLR